MEYKIVRLVDQPELLEQAAVWFHEKWGIPLEAYRESMEECLLGKGAVPQWYLAMEEERIIGGLGVIENDFHNRKDLSPNVCAVYTEEDRRCQGVAGALLKHVCEDMAEKGIDTLYLVTDHTSFYERYGWEYYCMVQGEGEAESIRMYRKRGGADRSEMDHIECDGSGVAGVDPFLCGADRAQRQEYGGEGRFYCPGEV